MNIFYLIISIITGIILGLIYFEGLKVTIEKAKDAENPHKILTLSGIIRTGTVILGFLAIVFFLEKWQYLLTGMGGFFLSRVVMLHKLLTEK